MDDISLYVQLFVLGFLLNMTWEVWHSQLYTTCLQQSWTKNVRLLTIMSLKDALFIVLFYLISFAIVREYMPATIPQVAPHVLFVFFALIFSFIDEKIAIARNRWEYSLSMPTLFGVGITPLLEIAVTGLLAWSLLFVW